MKNKKSLRGVFSKYADTSKVSLEGKAWQNYIINRVNQNDSNRYKLYSYI